MISKKHIMICICLGTWLSLLISCHGVVFPPPPETSAGIKTSYIIGVEDNLQISVWKQPDISVAVPVRSDGRISIPLINDIQAAGRTPDQLRKEIADKLAKFIEEPTVSVVVLTINSLKVTVSGNVNSPGVYKIGSEIRLVEAITLAGGLNLMADPNRILIIRKQNNVEKYYQVNYSDILEGKDINQNIIIYPGDCIVVP